MYHVMSLTQLYYDTHNTVQRFGGRYFYFFMCSSRLNLKESFLFDCFYCLFKYILKYNLFLWCCEAKFQQPLLRNRNPVEICKCLYCHFDQINTSLLNKSNNFFKTTTTKKSYWLQTSDWYCTITVNITHYW